jgi:hypothetical protein
MKRHDEGLWQEMEIRARNVTQKLALVARGSRKRGLKPPVRRMEIPRDPGKSLPHSGGKFNFGSTSRAKAAAIVAAMLGVAAMPSTSPANVADILELSGKKS